MERIAVIFTDVEMGVGGPTDDFPHASFLGALIQQVVEDARGLPVHVVFAGDTFDFLKTPVGADYPYHVTSSMAVDKFQRMGAAHAPFFDALSAVLASDPRHRVSFLVGNHDAEILFPAVRRAIREAAGGSDRFEFPGFALAEGPVWIEHGHQIDPLFRTDPERPFISSTPEPLLNLSWASIGLLSVVMPLHADLHVYNRLVPRKRLIELVPELRELFTALAWRYWTRDFWRGFLVKKDPLLTFEWRMLKEVVRRLVGANVDVDVDLDPGWWSAAVGSRPQRFFVYGHLHETAHRLREGKRVLQLGAFRDEYEIRDGGLRFEPRLKPFGVLRLSDDEILEVSTREVRGPRRAEPLPDSVYDLIPLVRRHLDALGDRSKDEAAQREQERDEDDSLRT